MACTGHFVLEAALSDRIPGYLRGDKAFDSLRQSGMEEVGSTYREALQGFSQVPDSTRTKTWWFHGEMETTREGITADLTAFKQVGIGGVVYYDQTHGSVQVTNSLVNRMIYDASLPEEKRLTYSSTSVVKSTDPLLPSGIIQVKFSLLQLRLNLFGKIPNRREIVCMVCNSFPFQSAGL